MKVNKMTYPTCPHCDVLINDLGAIPASQLFQNISETMNCSKCKKAFEVESRVEIVFKAVAIEKPEAYEDKFFKTVRRLIFLTNEIIHIENELLVLREDQKGCLRYHARSKTGQIKDCLHRLRACEIEFAFGYADYQSAPAKLKEYPTSVIEDLSNRPGVK